MQLNAGEPKVKQKFLIKKMPQKFVANSKKKKTLLKTHFAISTTFALPIFIKCTLDLVFVLAKGNENVYLQKLP